MKRQDFQRAIKRAFDLIISLLALILLSPLLGLIALTVRLTMGSSALFRQVRPGLRGEPFTIYKFRTMTDACDAQGNLLPDAERLTPFGRFQPGQATMEEFAGSAGRV